MITDDGSPGQRLVPTKARRRPDELESAMVMLKSPSEIAVMRRAGHILAEVMGWLPTFVEPGVSTLAIDTEVEALIRRRGATPAFKGYQGYPATACVSINAEVVHGIPSADRRLGEGDIVSVDVGCIVEGYYADCAATLAVGEIPASVRTLLHVTRESLELAISACRVGRRLSDVSHAVQTHVEGHGLAVVRAFVGHGIGRALHEQPEVPNFADPGRGRRLRPGMVLAIEPMVTMGTPDVEVQEDGWTAVTRDGSLSAHFEHTVAITEQGPAVLTRNDSWTRRSSIPAARRGHHPRTHDADDMTYHTRVSSEPRRDPQEFLRRAKEEEARRSRGRLKVFFGSAAGVGKTYAMLEAAREQREAGVDVVIGVVETHKRPETEELLAGLDILPPRLAEYHGTVLKEFDLDAALSRRPTLILVDELAHTNAPGGRHAKRWQDVLELRDAGINVYTTVNVQHLESLNDVVGKITGVTVRETIPDSVFAQADEVELIDLSPEDLRRRLEAGKVYIPERAGEAARNFFREGNLIALRELALRCAADHVDAQMQRYRRDRAVAPTWPVVERIMVCINSDPLSVRLVRAGRRLATRLGAQWVVAYVETPAHAELPAEDRARVAATLRFAERLGAETTTLTGARVSDEILAYARSRNVSQILIGKPARPIWKRILFGSDVDALVRGSGDIDISVISGERERDTIEPARSRSRRAGGAAYGLAVLAVLVSTGVASGASMMFPHFELSNIVMTYLLGVVAVAARWGRGPAVLAVLLSVAAFEFFFVPPYFSFAVDSQHLVTITVMLIVALVISGLTVRITRQGEAARDRERRTAALYALNRELAGTRGISELLEVGIRHVVDVLGGQIALLLPDGQGRLQTRATLISPFRLDSNDIAVAQWAYEHGQLAGAGTDNFAGGQMLFVPLRGSGGAVGVLGIRPSQPGALDDAEARRLLEAFANQIGLAIERSLLAEEAQRAELRSQAEQLRNSLLGSVSHDLRAPLTSITDAASTLVAGGDALDAATRSDLAETIHDEADRLNRLVSNLLDMTRLEAGTVPLHREWQPLEGVVGAALGRMGRHLEGHPVSTDLPASLPLVPVDGALIEQVFFNLLDNAVKYTPEGCPIEITARASNGAVTVSFVDRGPGLPADVLDRVFEKFYRAKPETGRGGAGLGLTICRAIVSAHGGRIWAENRPGGGLAFHFTLPLSEGPPMRA